MRKGYFQNLEKIEKILKKKFRKIQLFIFKKFMN